MIIVGNDPRVDASFTLSNRIRRGLWRCAWVLLFRPSPWFMHRWRAFLLRAFGARIGRDVHVYPGVEIWAPWLLTVGNRVGVANGVRLYSMAHISLGNDVVVSQGAHLCAGSHDIHSPNFQLIAKPITVEDNVWVCAEAFIGPGVRLASGVVVGARAVVVRSISSTWTVWAGNPAVHKGERRHRSET